MEADQCTSDINSATDAIQPAVAEDTTSKPKPAAASEDKPAANNSNVVADDVPTAQNIINKVQTHHIQVLQKILSNLYLNASKRLLLKYTPRCARDLDYCYQHHYHALLPNAPSFSEGSNLNQILSNEMYLTYMETLEIMCMRNVYPGEGFLNKIIELLLVVKPKLRMETLFQITYIEALKVFRLIVSTFPPCWRTMRPYYLKLFDAPVSYKNVDQSDSKKILPLIFELLENTLKQCDTDDLCSISQAYNNADNAEDSASKKNDYDILEEVPQLLKPYDWHKDEYNLNTFYSLKRGQCLTRVFDVLELLIDVFEMDAVMWLLHHHKKMRKFMLEYEKSPLVWLSFEMKAEARCSSIVHKLFILFAIATAKGLHRNRLAILERYISLMLEISNTADLEYSDQGYKYPILSKKTKQLIRELFQLFKVHNPLHISSYIEAATILRQPYVRYEFIDNFLQSFYYPKTEPFTPKKVFFEIIMKRSWKKYPARAATTNDDTHIVGLCREDYLKLLLLALSAYCDWHDTQQVFFYIKNKEAVVPLLQTCTESFHRTRISTSNIYMLEKFENEIESLEKQLKTTVRMCRPKVDLPLIKICIDNDVNIKYRSDLKYLLILAEQLNTQAKEHSEVDFQAWLDFLADFSSV